MRYILVLILALPMLAQAQQNTKWFVAVYEDGTLYTDSGGCIVAFTEHAELYADGQCVQDTTAGFCVPPGAEKLHELRQKTYQQLPDGVCFLAPVKQTERPGGDVRPEPAHGKAPPDPNFKPEKAEAVEEVLPTPRRGDGSTDDGGGAPIAAYIGGTGGALLGLLCGQGCEDRRASCLRGLTTASVPGLFLTSLSEGRNRRWRPLRGAAGNWSCPPLGR